MITDTDIMSLRVLLATGPEVMHPTGLHKLKRRHTRKNKWQARVQASVSGELIFSGADFWKLYALECSNVREAIIEAEVIRASQGFDSIVARISFTLNDAKWNADDCMLTVKVGQAGTVATNAQMTKEHNLLQILDISLHDRTSNYSSFYTGALTIKNGIWLKDAFEAICQEEGIAGVTSSLLQWNTSLPKPFPGTNWDRLVLHQLSDALRAGTPGLSPATKMEVSLDDLLNDICLLFNAQWDVDSNGILVIEHVSYWQALNGPDLTTGSSAILNERNARWEYERLDLPLREVFVMPNSSPSFSGWPLEYAVPSSILRNLKDDQKSHDFKFLTTDLPFVDTIRGGMLASQPLDADSMTGGLLLAVDSNDQVLSEKVYSTLWHPGDYEMQPNGPLAMSYTMPICWRANRPFRIGFINDTVYDLQKRRTRRQPRVKMQRCFAAGEDELVLDKRVKTALGWGDVAEADEDLHSGLVDMTVLHEDLLVTTTVPMTQAADITYTQPIQDAIDFNDPYLYPLYNWPRLANLSAGEYIRPFEKYNGQIKVFRDGTFYFNTPGLDPAPGIPGSPTPQPYSMSFQFVIINSLGLTSAATATINAQP